MNKQIIFVIQCTLSTLVTLSGTFLIGYSIALLIDAEDMRVHFEKTVCLDDSTSTIEFIPAGIAYKARLQVVAKNGEPAILFTPPVRQPFLFIGWSKEHIRSWRVELQKQRTFTCYLSDPQRKYTKGITEFPDCFGPIFLIIGGLSLAGAGIWAQLSAEKRYLACRDQTPEEEEPRPRSTTASSSSELSVIQNDDDSK